MLATVYTVLASHFQAVQAKDLPQHSGLLPVESMRPHRKWLLGRHLYSHDRQWNLHLLILRSLSFV